MESHLERLAAAITAQAAGIAVAGAGLMLVECCSDIDGRSNRSDSVRRFAIRLSQFQIALQNPVFDDGWFVDQFRCNRASFEYIFRLVEQNWVFSNDPIGANANFLIRDRVAVTLHYLAHSGNIAQSAKMFGMGKSSANRYIWQVIRVVEESIEPQFVRMPQSMDEWKELCRGFEQICGFPKTCLAIDGSLFEIERPHDYEGWYCRKLYPAMNVQLVVDYKGAVRSYDFRAGSANDKAVFNYSAFGQNVKDIIPNGMFVVADAGYKLSQQLIIPYPISDEMEPDESLFNYLHSRTRITVERAIGMVKNRFRILKLPLNQKSDEKMGLPATTQMARIVKSCLILHNLFLQQNDEVSPGSIGPDDERLHLADIVDNNSSSEGKTIRDAIKQYLYEK